MARSWARFASLLVWQSVVFAALMAGCAKAPDHVPRPFICDQCGCGNDSAEGAKGRALVSVAALISEMSDLRSLARPALVPFSSHLWSSYDRASISPETPSWFANSDHSQYVRQDGDEFVLMDAVGPGVITRIWSANPAGTIRIYLDDGAEPIIEAQMQDLLSGRVSPFGQLFAFSVARGYNFYFPIPFQRRAIVTSTSGDLYYQVNQRAYPEGTLVEPLRLPLDDKASCAYRGALKRDSSDDDASLAEHDFDLSSDPAEWIRLDQDRPGELTWLELTPAKTDVASLRGTILELRFDGLQTVRVPLGDFFGSGPGLAAVRSLAFGMTKDGTLTTRFPMPFKRTAEIRVSRATSESMTVRGRFHVEDRDERAPMLYFHAGWTGLRQFDAMEPHDLTITQLSGVGQYVGMVLNVANPDPQWWGEGDEEVFVDEAPFPTDFGTGTEDYFGYGWCSTELFARPLIGQTRANHSNNAGFISLYRLHMLDRIPFSDAFRFDLEALHWATMHRSVEMSYDAVYFWYGEEAATDRASEVPAQSFTVPVLPAGVVEASEGGATSC